MFLEVSFVSETWKILFVRKIPDIFSGIQCHISEGHGCNTIAASTAVGFYVSLHCPHHFFLCFWFIKELKKPKLFFFFLSKYSVSGDLKLLLVLVVPLLSVCTY